MKKWCESILVVVIITTIIEMLIPNGNSKKYIKVVIGLFLIFTIIEPFLRITKSYDSFGNFINVFSEEKIDKYEYQIENQKKYLNEIGRELGKEE